MTAPTSAGFAAICLGMVVAGLGIPVMAALNAGMAQHVGSPVAASVVLLAVALALTAAAMLALGAPPRAAFAGVPPYLYAGAGFFVAYLLGITWSAPRIGLGNAVFFVLLGQLVAATAIDHFGLFGAVRSALTGRRAVGLLVMALGVYLARKPR